MLCNLPFVDLLKSWGVPGGVAIVGVFALLIYMDAKRSSEIDKERGKKDGRERRKKDE